MKYSIFLIILLVSLNFCSGKTMMGKIVLDRNTNQMKTNLLKLIPIGSNIDSAKRILEKNHFKTSWMQNSDFMESNPALNISELYSKIDFLYADLEKPTGILSLISERWQIAVIHENKRVKQVLISYGKTGP